MLTICIRENKEEERNNGILTVSRIRQTRLAPDLSSSCYSEVKND